MYIMSFGMLTCRENQGASSFPAQPPAPQRHIQRY